MQDNEFIIDPLWHYTNADGLVGIFGSGNNPENLTFWFSRSDCLNDSSEGTHILILVNEILLKMKEKGEISDVFYQFAKDISLRNDRFIYFPIPSKTENEYNSIIDFGACRAYICCFSLKSDSLDMWRYYSKENGGYSLKLYPELFSEYKNNYTFNPDKYFLELTSYRVIYDDCEKEKIIKDIIKNAFSAFQSSSIPDNEKHKVINFLSYAFSMLKFKFKHSCFASEQEYRFIAFLPEEKPKKLENELMPVKFRARNGILVPYLELQANKGCLAEIKLSPFLHDENAISTMEHFLLQHKAEHVNVTRSELPVRF